MQYLILSLIVFTRFQAFSIVCDKTNYKDFIFSKKTTDTLIKKTGKGCNLREADLRELWLLDRNRGELKLKGIKISSGSSNVTLLKADLESAKLTWAKLSGADLRWANLNYANLIDADLHGANLSEADLEEANLWGANLRWADLKKANLYKANLHGAKLNGADLKGANLNRVTSARFGILPNTRNKLKGEANLKSADLKGATLWKADLKGANLKSADLSEANLEEANLYKADLTGADLYKTKLTGAIFPKKHKNMLTEKQQKQVKEFVD